MVDRTVNSGSDAQTGFAFQRNSALYILLDHYYLKFHDRNYFVCLEHHDDFLFCFINEAGEAQLIEVYQSKKRSTKSWTLDATMYEIINKLLDTGLKILQDEIPKAKNYSHLLHFVSNQTMVFQYGNKPFKREMVKEDNFLVNFTDFANDLQVKIQENVEINLRDQLQCLIFFWNGLNRTGAQQKQLLIGKSTEVFGAQIIDHSAAIGVLMNLFKDVELIYNQSNTPKLLDKTKRVSSDVIQQAFNILTTQAKAFDTWRSEATIISQALKIPLVLRTDFEFTFTTAFDLFKDGTQLEHMKILKFVKNNYRNCLSYDVGGVVAELQQKFINQTHTMITPMDVSAIIYAAYFEATLKR